MVGYVWYYGRNLVKGTRSSNVVLKLLNKRNKFLVLLLCDEIIWTAWVAFGLVFIGLHISLISIHKIGKFLSIDEFVPRWESMLPILYINGVTLPTIISAHLPIVWSLSFLSCRISTIINAFSAHQGSIISLATIFVSIQLLSCLLLM